MTRWGARVGSCEGKTEVEMERNYKFKKVRKSGDGAERRATRKGHRNGRDGREGLNSTLCSALRGRTDVRFLPSEYNVSLCLLR